MRVLNLIVCPLHEKGSMERESERHGGKSKRQDPQNGRTAGLSDV